MKIFIDTSAYLSILLLNDPNRQKAITILKSIKNEELVTSYAVLGEVLTVASQRYDKEKAIKFVQDIMNEATQIILEDQNLIKRAYIIFKQIKNKDVSWVDCYSFAIIEKYKIEKVFSFDRDFKKYLKEKVINYTS